MLAKLDCYDYNILPGIVQITLSATNDPVLVDILSEIERNDGRIYVEGRYFLMDGYEVFTQHHMGAPTYLNLKVLDYEMGDV